MGDLSASDATSWYRENAATYQRLSDVINTTLVNLLKSKKIDNLAISTRVKTLESVIEKIERKEYTSVSELTDIVGARIITYIESDIPKVCEILKEAFLVHTNKSVDKSEELRSDQIGYRSVHFICELGEQRIALPELIEFKNLQFEVQIRTVLQHAWAEIEHDRSYKFAGVLPAAIQRRLNLAAGTLEIIDREFSALAAEVDAYDKEIRLVAKAGGIAQAEITSASLSEYFSKLSDISAINSDGKSKASTLETIAEELKLFGIQTIEDFQNLITAEFKANLDKNIAGTTILGFARKAMMHSDADKYFHKAWGTKWQHMSSDTKRLLQEKYGDAFVAELFQKYKLLESPKDRVRKKAAVRKEPPATPAPT